MSSMVNGVYDSNGIYWTKCEEAICGDSKKPWKAHKALYPDGGTYCFKCNTSSTLDIGSLLEIALGNKTIEEVLDNVAELFREEKQIWQRGTILSQYAISGETNWVSYEMRNANGRRLGWHNRCMKNKEFDTDGRRGIGFVGDSLTSSPSKPLIIVEGPADVLDARHACVFGAISPNTMNHFRLQHLWLFPDPDQVDSVFKKKQFAKTVIAAGEVAFPLGVILGNADPDEATILHHIPVQTVLESWV